MNYTVENQGKIVIFTLKHANVGSEVAAELKARLLIICQPDIEALIMDLSAVEMIESSGLGALLLAKRQLSEHEIPIALIGVKGMLQSLLQISQIDNLFMKFENVDEAVAAIQEDA